MLESYEAYVEYTYLMDFVQSYIQTVANETIGGTRVSFRGHDFDLGGDWRRVTMVDLVADATGDAITLDSSVDELRAICARRGVAFQEWWSVGLLIGELYDKVAEETIVSPTIVYDYPVEISPLARHHRDDPRLVERFEIVCCATELGNAYSELNDPIEQRKRFEAQMEARARGDLDANVMDLPYVQALEYGMPPTGGLGVGIDRLTMVLAGMNSIREVILFPALRPQTTETTEDA
jgi:lysyl-tRNA synthetase class 2